ncbi:MAG: hypothetical protein QOJ66_3149, partial [Ilumatobacteraceae bacterium]
VFADWIRPGLGDRPASGAFGVGLLVVGAVCSFILMYIWTIVSLRRSLEKAARDIEGLWSDLVADVAAGRVSAEEVKTQLRANPPLLAHIKSNQDYTPPRLTRLADEVEAEPKV